MGDAVATGVTPGGGASGALARRGATPSTLRSRFPGPGSSASRLLYGRTMSITNRLIPTLFLGIALLSGCATGEDELGQDEQELARSAEYYSRTGFAYNAYLDAVVDCREGCEPGAT